MEVLRDLHKLQSVANSRFRQYQGRDFVLPDIFKQRVTEINSNLVTYNEFSAIIETRGNQNGVLNIFLPNQWFYIASYFTDFYNELLKYKKEALKVAPKERLKELNGSSLSAQERSKMLRLSLDETSKRYLERFITDYSWWSGAKTIDRGDFYVSPILNSARLVNASQSFVADLCAFLADKQDLVKAIIDGEEQNERHRGSVSQVVTAANVASSLRPYITAIKSKPFLLLAGISGTGKSRIVRELARACWEVGSEESENPRPRNFEMVQVKPNWHDSSELIGYVSRVSGKPVFVVGDFLRFVARAWEEPEVPYFLCLDEMNLAPVEQYFVEYLSVVESRKAKDGMVVTDPILPAAVEEVDGEIKPKPWYAQLIKELLATCPPDKSFGLKTQFETDGICLPQNLIVVGTVNMDETTFSFSRKVLDRAMTIEMNEVDLEGGLTEAHERIGLLSAAELIGTAVEGKDVYAAHKAVCDTAIRYLQGVNEVLEGTPFKIAYRTRNEVLLYVVNNLPYNQIEDDEESEYKEEFVVARALDEITSMKILSRIEGDDTKVSEPFLKRLGSAIKQGLEAVFEGPFEAVVEEDDEETCKSVSLAKLEEMKERLKSGYTSFWS